MTNKDYDNNNKELHWGKNPMNADCLREISFHVHPEDIDSWVCVSTAVLGSIYMKRNLFDRKYAKLWGVDHGTITVYRKNGQKDREANYYHGMKHGTITLWHDNGKKQSELSFDMGELCGRTVIWNRDGYIVINEEYLCGIDVSSGIDIMRGFNEKEKGCTQLRSCRGGQSCRLYTTIGGLPWSR